MGAKWATHAPGAKHPLADGHAFAQQRFGRARRNLLVLLPGVLLVEAVGGAFGGAATVGKDQRAAMPADVVQDAGNE